MYQGPGKKGACCFSASHQGGSLAGKDCAKELGTREDSVQYFSLHIYPETSHRDVLSHISGNQTCEKYLCLSCPQRATATSFTQKDKKDICILSEPSPLAFERLS